jgi:hypothetical protein
MLPKKIAKIANRNSFTIREMRVSVFLLCFSGITILWLDVRKFSNTLWD